MQKKKELELTRMEIFQKEQLILAKERTILSFMQVGLASIGIGIIMARFFEEFLFRIIGFALIILGSIEAFESTRRLRKKQKEMEILKEELRKAI